MMALLFRIAVLAVAVVAIRRGLRYLDRHTLRGQSAPPSLDRNPFEVLGISPTATAEEIRAAYKRELQKYHPDKVAEMGEDLRQLAEQRTREIIEAYHRLK